MGTQQVKALEKRIAELETALEQIGNVLGPGTCAACQCEGCAWETKEAVRLAASALTATGQQEHPDTGRLDKLERWLRTHSDERAVVIRDNGIVRGCPSCWLGQDLAGDVVGVTLRCAIDALPGEEARNA